MAMATYSSTYKGNEDGRAHLRDASFSSYLDSTERDFVRSLAASIHSEQSPAWESSVTNTPRSCREKNRISHADELGVFGAERYFNEKLEDRHKIPNPIPKKNCSAKSKHRYRRENTLDLLETKSTNSNVTTTTSTISLKSPTPSLKSQESWNNQYNGINLFSNLQGVCSNKKSIYTIKTKEMVQSPKSSYKGDNNSKFRERNKVSHHDHFEFPIIQSTSYNYLEDNQPRKSLEVFGFKHIEKQDMSFLAWDAIPNYQNNASLSFSHHPNTKKTSQNMKVVDHHEQHLDARSDTSSDLFEIENLSGFHHQSSCATSEASIEWSVVTASAAELSVDSIRCESKKVPYMEKMKVQKSLSSSLGGGLLGCKNHKAIDVIVGSFNTRNNKKN